MKAPHLQGGALLTACAAGQGAVVVVEGEHREDDEWFYSRWFGHLGPSISFFAQNGWEKVVSAVAKLRSQLHHRPVFGIIDGDFEVLGGGTASDPYIYRLPRYTLENYLLEPEGWFRVVKLVTRGAVPVGWGSAVEVALRVEEAYRACHPLAARNRTVWEEHRRHPVDSIGFREHPDALTKLDPLVELAAWGESRATPRPLADVYAEHFDRLGAADPSTWHAEVTGKAVLKALVGAMNLATKRQVPLELYCSMFLAEHPRPHADLTAIVDSILQAARL